MVKYIEKPAQSGRATLFIILTFWGCVREFSGFGQHFGLRDSLQYNSAIAGEQLAVMVGSISTFFTSVWLWLYAASVLVSRILVRMSGGVGFLLKVTDVEHHPFRSMGFTSVALVSFLFLVALPFVLVG